MTIRKPDDFHVHLRQSPQDIFYARDAKEAGFARVLAMPNTVPPLCSPEALSLYKSNLENAASGLDILLSFKIKKGLTFDQLSAMKAAGAIAGKLYPAGVTTNSEDGIKDLHEAWPVFADMEKLGLVLCLHGEDPDAFTFDREKVFLSHLSDLVKSFPKLKIVLEHVSTSEGVDAVNSLGPNIGATITVHHLLYVFDDLMGGSFNPHLFCKPLLKRGEDRDALQDIVLSGNTRFFFGSDSAPHLRTAKESGICAPGIYSMPVSLALLASFFEEKGCLDRLEPFVSEHGTQFYGLTPNSGTLNLEKITWTVPNEYHGVVPLAAGQTLTWKVN